MTSFTEAVNEVSLMAVRGKLPWAAPARPHVSLAHLLSVHVRDEWWQLGRQCYSSKTFCVDCARGWGGGAIGGGFGFRAANHLQCSWLSGGCGYGRSDRYQASVLCAQHLLLDHQTQLKTVRFTFILDGGQYLTWPRQCKVKTLKYSDDPY